MNRTIAALCLALAAAPATAADTTELSYQAVMHVVSAETLAVLDDARHEVGIPAFSGLAIFADGEVVPHRYAGWFETVDGKGDFRGTARWYFPDGELTANYEGHIEARPDDFDIKANFVGFSGTGRFEGVSGEGTFQGERYEAVTSGGATYLKGTLTLKLGV